MIENLNQLAHYRNDFGVLRGTVMFLTGFTSEEIDDLGGFGGE